MLSEHNSIQQIETDGKQWIVFHYNKAIAQHFNCNKSLSGSSPEHDLKQSKKRKFK